MVIVSVIGFQIARRRKRPWFEAGFPALPQKPIDRSLLVGSLLCGIAWGLAGYCPGPALAGRALGNDEVLVFLVAMLAGGYLQQGWARRRSARWVDPQERRSMPWLMVLRSLFTRQSHAGAWLVASA